MTSYICITFWSHLRFRKFGVAVPQTSFLGRRGASDGLDPALVTRLFYFEPLPIKISGYASGRQFCLLCPWARHLTELLLLWVVGQTGSIVGWPKNTFLWNVVLQAHFPVLLHQKVTLAKFQQKFFSFTLRANRFKFLVNFRIIKWFPNFYVRTIL